MNWLSNIGNFTNQIGQGISNMTSGSEDLMRKMTGMNTKSENDKLVESIAIALESNTSFNTNLKSSISKTLGAKYNEDYFSHRLEKTGMNIESFGDEIEEGLKQAFKNTALMNEAVSNKSNQIACENEALPKIITSCLRHEIQNHYNRTIESIGSTFFDSLVNKLIKKINEYNFPDENNENNGDSTEKNNENNNENVKKGGTKKKKVQRNNITRKI